MLKAIDGDKGLVVKNPAAHHAISAKFDKKIDNKGKTLVVQYEVKLQSKNLVLPPLRLPLTAMSLRWFGVRRSLHEAASG